ncbi:cytochrome P450, partial [Mycena capillaripes]
MRQVFNNGVWTAQYGRTVRINGFIGFSQLFTTDTKAVHHVLSNSYVCQKAAMRRYFLGRVVGVLVVEGDVHRQQNPAFGPAQVRALTGIFVQKSRQLRDIWADRAAQSGGVARVNVIPEFSTATLDSIGQAGFNYQFQSLGTDSRNGGRDELHEAFATISATGDKPSLLDTLKSQVPILGWILIDKVIDDSQVVMRRIGQRLLSESKQKIADGSSADSIASRDLLSLLVRANTAKDIPEAQRLSDEDVLAHKHTEVPTFLVAGHETTAATWALFALAKNREIQTRLRNEVLAVDNESPSMEELNALPTSTASIRAAVCDDFIPLDTPYTDRTGTEHETLRLVKGQVVAVPIVALNRDPAIWGSDAHEFIGSSTSSTGLWSHMLTFLGGPHACIGYRFSLVELKALLFTLVRGLEFELAVSTDDIGRLPTNN